MVRRVAPEEQNVAIGARRSPIERIGNDNVTFAQLAAGEHAFFTFVSRAQFRVVVEIGNPT